ncbi:KdsC family phosphatase [Pararobbsia silviterrae]|uniref:3-deoxy-D-manno-octulosonate 8-phosphate phosphatase KdsC n=1 Tax=Pararobbsia silviterrae TaxID=1792498 RepID=A0A494YER3_9BURK|nr:3-deoxy-D-manno-octulosonate 8-phosphate phosphatase [Pararobbsia silviterrae]RKP58843.1 3-deoxy-D-manno-octulosonate 8-phosphate phosphatase [Pararobbsia silviterrae]
MAVPVDPSGIDAALAERLAAASARAARLQLMVFDVDGVLTDGRLHYGPDGEEIKTFDTLDGHGVKLLRSAGVQTAIITGRSSKIVASRAKELGFDHVFQGVHDKTVVFAELLSKTGIAAADTGYMGDDWPDLAVMLKAGFAAAPANAHIELARRAHYVAQARGGRGAVREVCDLILRARGYYDALLEHACGVS